MIIKPIGSEISVTSANTVNNATLVRVLASSDALITVANTAGSNTGSFTVVSDLPEIIEKESLGTIASNTAVKCVSVSYKS